MDIQKMDLKWQLALLIMRTRRTLCKECRGPRKQDSRNRNQDSSRRTVNVEETSSKAMVAIDGAGFDWSYMTDDKVLTNMALMAFSDSEFNKSKFNLATYKRGLTSVEEKLVFYKKNEDDYNYHQRERVVSRNNYIRVNYNYSAKKARPSAHRNMVPIAVLMKTGLRALNTTRPVNTSHPKTIGHPQKEDQGYVDSGCSRHMTRNMSYLSNFKEFDLGLWVNFGGGRSQRMGKNYC
ncbi:hypothetical protein Tco_1237460 [Tanacetum coccineum]